MLLTHWLKTVMPSRQKRGAAHRNRRQAWNISPRNLSCVETLEDRTLLSQFAVTTSTDENDALGAGGDLSLREAIAEANNLAGADTIVFAEDFTGTITIDATNNGALPALSDDVQILGPGADRLTVSGANQVRVFEISPGVTVEISGLTIANGNRSSGAGIANIGGNLTVTNSVLRDNTATSLHGGGILNTSGSGIEGILLVQGSTFQNNSAQSQGGGIQNAANGEGPNPGSVTVRNSTFSQNTAGANGGGVSTQSAPNITRTTLVNSTLTQNVVESGGGSGGGLNAVGLVIVVNTIISGNTFSGNGEADEVVGAIDSGSNNLIGGDAGSILDPNLQDNGGPTETHALIADSPAIDGGSDAGLSTDQRGGDRKLDGKRNGTESVDIGAVEYLFPLVVDTTSDVDDGDYAANNLSLREAIRLANENPGPDAITFGGTVFTDATTPDVITLGGSQLDITDDLTITGLGASQLTISGNNASRIFNIDDGNSGNQIMVSISGLTLTAGRAIGFSSDGSGGAIFNRESLTVTNSTLSQNSADSDGFGSGGGIENLGTLMVTNSTLSQNSAYYGGAIRNYSALTITNSTLFQNSANSEGGGMYNLAFSLMEVINSTLSQNSANEHGGGIWNNGTLMVTNSTITGNVADADNDSTSETGGGIFAAGSETLRNTIVAGNFVDGGSGTGTANDITGTIDTANNNLIGDAASSGGITHDNDGNPNAGNNNIVGNSGSGTIDINTVLETTLADNGGPTRTHALLDSPANPAIDAGDNAFAKDDQGQDLLTDQRGFAPRNFDSGGGSSVDIGAFELGAIDPANPVITHTGGTPGNFVVFLDNGELVVEVNNVEVHRRDIDDLDTLTLEGDTNDDSFTIQLPAGGLFDLEILVVGNDQMNTNPGDRLIIQGGSSTTATFNHDNTNDGSVVLTDGTDTTTITYTGLEPVNMTGSTAANLVVNLTGDADETAFRISGGNLIVDNTNTPVQTHEDDSIDLTGVTNIEINAGAGADVLTFETISPGDYAGTWDIDGEGDADDFLIESTATINLLGSFTLENNEQLTVDGTLALSTGNTLTLDSGSLLEGGGSVTGIIAGNAGSTITATGNLTLGDAAQNAFATEGTLNVGTHTVTLHDSGPALLGESTTLAGGTLIAANGINLSGSDVLLGNGTIDVGGIGGSELKTFSGTISPGSSPGLITVDGDLDLAGGNFAGELDGNAGPGVAGGHDQIAATNGGVDVTGANLDLTLNFIPVPGTSFVLIDNEGGDAVTGNFTQLNGAATSLGEGALFFLQETTSTAMIPFMISYAGGAGNNDVVLSVVRPTSVIVDADFAGTAPGDDPDGGGPATIFGYDAFATIQEGVDAIAPGAANTVTIHQSTANAGVYAENVVIAKDLTLDGATGTAADVIITPSGGDAIMILSPASNVTLSDFQVTGAGEDGIDADGLSSLTVTNVHAIDNTGDGFDLRNAQGAVVFTNVVGRGNQRGAFLAGPGNAGAGSFQDTDGDFSLNNDGGIVLQDIEGDATLTRTTLNNNDADMINGGDGLFAGAVANAAGIGGNLTIRGATIQDTDAAGTGVSQAFGVRAMVTGHLLVENSTGVVQANTITGNRNDGLDVANTSGTASATITNGTFSNNQAFGITTNGFATTQITNATAEDNTVGLRVDGGDLTVEGGSFSNNTSFGIEVRLTTSATIEHGSITGNDLGVGIDSNVTGTVSINENDLSGNTAAFVQNDEASIVNAEFNFFGLGLSDADIAAGMTGTGAGVDFTPYLDNGDAETGTPGFQADFSSLSVTVLGQQIGGGPRIQEGLDAVTAGGTVHLSEGTFAENPEINKDLTLNGSGPATVIDANSGHGVTLDLPAPPANVTIQNLRITDADDGIFDDTTAAIASLSLINLQIDASLRGGLLSDIENVNVTLTGNADTAHVNSTQFDSTGLQAIEYTNATHLNLNGDLGSDTFNVDPISSTSLTINGGDPPAGAVPGDTLNYNGPGELGFNSTLMTETITQTGFNPVNYSEIETVTTDTVSGTNGNFIITAGADADDGDNDAFIVRRIGDNIQVLVVPDSGPPAVLVFSQQAANVVSLTIAGSNDNDTLTVDYDGDDIGGIDVPIPSGGLFYNGKGDGISDKDVLIIQDGTVTAVTHTFASAHSGTVTIQPTSTPLTGSEGTITYTGLEPITDALITPARTFNFGAASDQITLADAPNMAGRNRISSAGTSETVDFRSPTMDLTINAGSGNDTINVLALDNSSLAMGGFNANLTINGESDQDTINLLATTDVDDAVDNLYSLNGGSGADTFHLTPTSELLSEITINGNTPSTPSGDVLNFDGIAAVLTTGIGSGTVDPAANQDVMFSGIEMVNTINPPQLSIADASVEENVLGGQVSVTITLSRGVVQPVTVDVITASGSALAGSDFTGLNQTLTFRPGDPLMQTVTLSITDDAIVELDEEFFVNLSNASGAAIVDGTANVAIADDDNDAAALIGIDDVTQTEGNGGQKNFVFTISLDKAVDVPVSLLAATANGTAMIADNDFVANMQTLTFLPGERTKTFTVQVNGDLDVEDEETFLVNLTNLEASGRNVVLDDTQGDGTIANDDATTLTISNVSRAEGDDGMTPTVFPLMATLSQPVAEAVTLSFDVIGTGTSPVDPADFPSGLPTVSFTFLAGQTTALTTLEVAGDLDVEPNETFRFALSTTSNESVQLGMPATGTILNDDFSVAIGPTTIDRLEGNIGDTSYVYTLTRTGDVSHAVTLNYAITGSGTHPATANDFGTNLTGQVTFSPGQSTTTLTILVQGDQTVEHEEGFTVTIEDPLGKAQITTASATGTIRNDDTTVISVNSVSGSETGGMLTFTITASNPFAEDIELTLNKSTGSAGIDDFDTTSQMVTFTAGTLSTTVDVVIEDDELVEFSEAFQVSLQTNLFGTEPADSRVQIDPVNGTGTGTILDNDQVVLSIVEAMTINEAEEDAGSLTFSIRLSDADHSILEGSFFEGDNRVTVDVVAIPQSALGGGEDYTFAPLTITFDANDMVDAMGSITKDITVNLTDDALVEMDEQFVIQLQNPRFGNTSAGLVTDANRVTIDPTAGSRTGQINDEDKAEIWISDMTGVEGGAMSFTVTLDGLLDKDVTLLANTDTTDPISAMSDVDFTSVSNLLLTFNAHSTVMQTRSVVVQLDDDGISEPDEEFLVRLSDILFGGTSTDNRVQFVVDPADSNDTTAGEALGTIQDQQPPVQVNFTANSLEVEGNEDEGPLTFTINLSGAEQDTVTVRVSTMRTTTGGGVDAVDTNEDDFTPLDSFEVVFLPGELSKTVTIDLSLDAIVEPDETFEVHIDEVLVDGASQPSRAVVGSDRTALGTILNDDFANLTISSPTMIEGNPGGNSVLTFVVTLDAEVQGGLTINYATQTNGSASDALPNRDYLSKSGMLMFGESPDTRQVQVEIVEDLITERDETFLFVLSGLMAQNTDAVTVQANAQGQIDNDDSIFVTGADAGGGPNVIVTNQFNQQIFNFMAYPGFTGGVRVATGDVNNDGVPDIITAPGPGGGPHVKVFDGVSGIQVASFLAYPSGMTAGLFVTAADVNSNPDGFADIIVAPDAGGGPHVKVFNGMNFSDANPPVLKQFMAYDTAFTGGVRVATGDVNGDGIPDLITGAGPGGGPNVRVFDLTKPQGSIGTTLPGGVGNFMAFRTSYTGGIYVAAGDFGGDSANPTENQADIVVGQSSGSSRVRIFDAADLSFAQINAFPGFAGGVRVATVERFGDATPDLVVAAGPGGGPHVQIFDGGTAIDVNDHPASELATMTEEELDPSQPPVASFSAFAYNPNFTGGVFAAGTVFPPSAGSPLRLADNAILPTGPVNALHQADLDSTVAAALTRFELAGLDASLAAQLAGTPILIGHLAPGLLGLATDAGILIDEDAAGAGWYIDPTPLLDEEFQTQTDGPLAAALGRVDLLTVVLHEFGHALGLGDLAADHHPADFMSETLAPNLRRLPDEERLDGLFADGPLLDDLLLSHS